MNLRQYLIEHSISHDEAAQIFGVTEGIISGWIERGVPQSRRPDVIARTNGEVRFHDDVATHESALMHVDAAIIGLETIQVEMSGRTNRQRMQHYINMLYYAKQRIEG